MRFTSTAEILASIKELFNNVFQQVMEAELEEKLGYEKSARAGKRRRRYPQKLSKLVLEQDGKDATGRDRCQDRNGEYEPQISAWQNRPLESVCPFVFMDAILYKVTVSDQLRIMFSDRELR